MRQRRKSQPKEKGDLKDGQFYCRNPDWWSKYSDAELAIMQPRGQQLREGGYGSIEWDDLIGPALIDKRVFFRQRGVMPNKDKPLVDRHAPKDGVGWLVNDTQGKVCRFANDMATAHAHWVEVETRPLEGDGQQVIRRLLRHNTIAAWVNMQKSGGWKRCQPKW